MPKKIELYTEQRSLLLINLFDILGINDNNNTFILGDFNNDSIKKQKVIDLIPDIKKYFNSSQWNCLNDKRLKNREISIIRTVLKNMNYELTYKQINKKLSTGKYDTKIIYYVNPKKT